MPPQMIKISSLLCYHSGQKNEQKDVRCATELPCPYQLLRDYLVCRGGYVCDSEPYFIFRDRSPVTQTHFRVCLRLMLKLAGFQEKFYGTHSLRAGRSCDLYKLGISVETIKKIGRWKSNTVFRYLKV